MFNFAICSADGVCSPRSGACAFSYPGSPISFTASHQTIAQARVTEVVQQRTNNPQAKALAKPSPMVSREPLRGEWYAWTNLRALGSHPFL